MQGAVPSCAGSRRSRELQGLELQGLELQDLKLQGVGPQVGR